ncbi:multidrug ABC transporter ATP-binding protein [Salinibacter sp. 10B]|uniref:ABC transporter ATP-binding protein n=1 Tax=Salinibacter sp. 10B TaxID=1923971 RepID=UPI000CF441E1|nr:ABC transporter ATP-binding protein [Salinibacter sp. 10B]PQJ35633.1 multidrug ABC transporter ATP-binding protein [Salinibacter sp. 10B]
MHSTFTATVHDARRRLGDLLRALHLVWEAARRWTLLWVLFLVVQGTIPTATVYLTKWLVDAVAEGLGGGLTWEVAVPVLIPAMLVGGLMLLAEVFGGLMGWVQTAQSEYLRDHIKGQIHEKAVRVDLAFYESPAYYDHMAMATDEAEGRTLSLLQSLGQMIQSSITLMGVALLLLPYAWWLPLALLVSTAPALWVVLVHRRRHHAWWEDTAPDRRWTNYFNRVLTLPFSAAEVRLFGLGSHFQEQYRTLREELRNGLIRLTGQQNWARLGAASIGLLVTVGVMAWMGMRALGGRATLGDLALFYRAFTEGKDLMRTLLNGAGSAYSDALYLEHLFTFLELTPQVTSPAEPVALPSAQAREIRFEEVGFRYPDSDEWALRNFSLTIPAGKTVAVVGPNGAGKSTLTKLLCRFYDPQEGRILVDGVDLRDCDLEALRDDITVMFQYPMQYIATAAGNIQMGDRRAEGTRERVKQAARAGGAHRIIERLPDGYDTLLGKQFEGGVELSGGQWQRITLARAFYRKAPIVILDEPTSFMDSWAEMQWLERFRTLVSTRTAILVTHRFTTAMQADLIFVMVDGQVVETGSHEDLVTQEGMYADSWQAQTTVRELGDDRGASAAPEHGVPSAKNGRSSLSPGSH